MKKLLSEQFLSKRNLTIALFIGMIPMLVLLYSFYLKTKEHRALQEHFCFLKKKADKTFSERVMKKQFYEQFGNCDPSFIKNELEALPLLKKETDAYSKLSHHSLFGSDSSILQRYSFLKENRLTFKEEKPKTTKNVKETEIQLVHPVEVDPSDLAAVLSRIEGMQIGDSLPIAGSPQLIITHFHLERTKDSPHYLIHCHLLKREFVKP